MMNPNQAQPEQQPNEDDDIVDEAEFLDSNDVIEVATLDDTMDHVEPMDDDDDDDDDVEIEDIDEDERITDADADPDRNDDEHETNEPPSPELFLTISSHSGPVYTCSAVPAPSSSSSSTTSLLIATGGGDDIACLTQAELPVMTIDPHNMTSTEPMNDDNGGGGVTSATQQLAYQHSDSVSAVAFGLLTTATAAAATTSTLLLAVGGYDGMIVLYDGTTGNCLMNMSNKEEFKSNFAGPTDIEWLTFHKTGTVLLAGSSTDGTVWMYHVVAPSPNTKQPPYYTLNCMQVLVGHASMVTAGGFTADGRWAVTIGNSGTRDDATLRVWNPKTGIAKHTIHLHSGSTTGILMSTNNNFANDDDDGDDDDSPFAGLTCLAFGIADAESLTATTTLVPNNGAPSSSKLLLVGSEDGWAYVCHVGTGKVLHAFRHAAEPLPIRYHQGGMDVVDSNQHNETTPATEVLLSIEAVGFCPSHPMWCATGGADGVLKIWDLSNGQCRHLCRYAADRSTPSDNDHPSKGRSVIGGITRLCWLPSNTAESPTAMIAAVAGPPPPIVFVATTDGMVHVWDARNGGLLRTLHTGGRSTILDLQVICVIHSNRIVVVTASEDHVVRLFQIDLVNLLQQQPKQ